MTLWKLYYHFVWATKHREAVISSEYDEIIKRSIRLNCQETGVLIHAVETMPDHVHLVVSIPPTLSLSQFMNKIKGASSHLINDKESTRAFYWQPEYGVHSFSEDALPRIVDYVLNQRAHHETKRFWRSLELIDRPKNSDP